jgi:hypothetical protein
MATRKKIATRKPTRKTKTSAKSLAVVSEPIAAIITAPVVPEPVVTPAVVIPDEELKLYKRPALLLVITLFLGWIFDFLFWEQSAGINFAIFLFLCLLGGFSWLALNELKPSRNSLWLLIPILFFVAVTFLRKEPLTIFLAFSFSLLSIGLLGTSYLGGRWFEYSLSNYMYKFFLLVRDILSASSSYISKVRHVQESAVADKGGIPIWGLLRGLLFALPILICFGTLLAAGDLVFKEKLDNFLELDDLTENILRGLLILFYTYVLGGSLIHAALRSRDNNLAGENKPIIKPFLGFAESTVILGSVSILFMAFVIVQFQYFFGGETNIGVEGYTYSQYARRGFNELVVVAFLSLVLILGMSSVTHPQSESQRRTYSILSVVLVALVIVILVSAYQRISLAIDWHGFSRLRLYPRVFLIWLGLLFVTVVVLGIFRKERYFALAAVFASVGFAVTLTLVNVDAATVRHNVPRTLKGKNLNVAHLASLSSDAVPALADEFYSDKYSQDVHEGIGAALTCYLHFDSYDDSLDDWRSFNLSRWQARNTLQEVEKHLQDYGINAQRSWNVKVRTPNNVWYECEYHDGAEED